MIVFELLSSNMKRENDIARQNPIVDTSRTAIVDATRDKKIEIVTANMPKDVAQPIIADLKNAKTMEALGAVDNKYKSIFKQYGIWDQIQKIQAEGVKQYNETKSKIEIGQKEQMQSAANIRRTKELAGFVGSAEEEGAKKGKEKLDEGKAAKAKTDFFT